MSQETECHSRRECVSNTTWEHPTWIHHFSFGCCFQSKIKVCVERWRGQAYSNRLSDFLFFCPQPQELNGATFWPMAGSLGPCVPWRSSPSSHSWPALCGETKVASMQVRRRLRRPRDKTCSPWKKVSYCLTRFASPSPPWTPRFGNWTKMFGKASRTTHAAAAVSNIIKVPNTPSTRSLLHC